MKQMTVSALMVDGTEHTDVPVTMRDKLNYSDTRGRHKWPPVEEDPFRFMAYLAFSALRRTGKVSGGFDAFVDQLVDVDSPDEDDLTDVDPTTPAP